MFHTETGWLRRGGKPMLLIVVLVLGVVLRISDLGSVGRRTPDEQNYSWEAGILADRGFAQGTAELTRIFAENPGLPAPSRLGYLEAVSGTMRMSGLRGPRAGVALSCVASCLALVLLAWIGLRFFGISVALVATLLYAVSPVALMLGRRAWEDSFVELLSLLSLAVAGELALRNHSRRGFYGLCAAWAALGAVCLVSKEMALVAFLLSAVLAGSAAVLGMKGRRGLMIAACAVVGPLLALCWMAYVFGGFRALVEMPLTAQHVLSQSAYSVEYESGTPISLARGLWAVSPPTILLLVCAAVLPRRWTFGKNWPTARGLALFSAALLLTCVVVPHRLNFRYVCGAFGPMALLAGMGFQGVSEGIAERAPAGWRTLLVAVAAVLAVVGAGTDLHRFRERFEKADMQDLAIRMLLNEPSAATPSFAAGPEDKSVNEWVNSSLADIQGGRYEEGIADAKHALALDPKNALAWNNVSVANGVLGRWDEAIDAAQKAILLDPNLQLAKNNLAWELAEQRKSGGR